ncbi:hypothetical protein MHBO_000418 [Bonamia ostreae]|uniref:Uncharacterized protein n=1 Tax=Bonamia ostreae TaxID=126728 RepID=A0ABV2AFI4_9EUKA
MLSLKKHLYTLTRGHFAKARRTITTEELLHDRLYKRPTKRLQFGRFPVYDTEADPSIDKIDQSRYSPRGLFEPLKPSWGKQPRKPTEVGKPADISHMMPHVRSGAFADRSLVPEELVLRGGDPVHLLYNSKFVSPNAPYLDMKTTYTFKKDGDAKINSSETHRRPEDALNFADRAVQRFLDDRFVDLGSSMGTIVLVGFYFYVIYKLFKGVLKSKIHFGGSETDFDYLPIDEYFNHLEDKSRDYIIE